MAELLWLLAAVVAWAALLYKAWDLLRERGRPDRLVLAAALAGIVLALTFAAPPVYVAFDHLVGIPNLARMMMHIGAMGFSISVQWLLLHWVYPAEQARRWARRWVFLYAPALIAQVVFFVLAPIDAESAQFTTRYGNAPFVPEFLAVLAVCLILTMADIARLSRRFARVAGRPFLRIGLRLTFAGALCGIVYWVVEALYLPGRSLRLPALPGGLEQTLLAGCSFVGAACMTAGLTIPAWGPRLARAGGWCGRHRAYRRLRPLWFALYRASPEIALDVPSARNDALRVRDLDYRLVRRVVEIRDGRLALRPYFDPAVVRLAQAGGERAGLAGVALLAVVEATTIADAIRSKSCHAMTSGGDQVEVRGGEDLASEALWLGHVADALARSPIVASTLRASEKVTVPTFSAY